MKQKQTAVKAIHWVNDALLKGLVIFLIIGFGYYAYAQVSWPSESPNPVSGVVGIFVGESSAAYTASINGYVDANDECESAFASSHICTTAEMTNSYNHGTGDSSSNTGVYWINSAAPGNISPAINDCNGWTDVDWSPYYGTVWNFDLDASGIQSCGVATLPVPIKFACCQ